MNISSERTVPGFGGLNPRSSIGELADKYMSSQKARELLRRMRSQPLHDQSFMRPVQRAGERWPNIIATSQKRQLVADVYARPRVFHQIPHEYRQPLKIPVVLDEPSSQAFYASWLAGIGANYSAAKHRLSTLGHKYVKQLAITASVIAVAGLGLAAYYVLPKLGFELASSGFNNLNRAVVSSSNIVKPISYSDSKVSPSPAATPLASQNQAVSTHGSSVVAANPGSSTNSNSPAAAPSGGMGGGGSDGNSSASVSSSGSDPQINIGGNTISTGDPSTGTPPSASIPLIDTVIGLVPTSL